MKTTKTLKLAIAAALAFGTATVAQADVVCDRCAYQGLGTTTYLGAYWPGDYGTFFNRNVGAAPPTETQPGIIFANPNHYMFDLNATADVTLSLATTFGTSFKLVIPGGWWADMYFDAGTVCNATFNCGRAQVMSQPDLLGIGGATRRISGEIRLSPGRYVFIVGGTMRSATDLVSYRGALRVRPVQ